MAMHLAKAFNTREKGETNIGGQLTDYHKGEITSLLRDLKWPKLSSYGLMMGEL